MATGISIKTVYRKVLRWTLHRLNYMV